MPCVPILPPLGEIPGGGFSFGTIATQPPRSRSLQAPPVAARRAVAAGQALARADARGCIGGLDAAADGALKHAGPPRLHPACVSPLTPRTPGANSRAKCAQASWQFALRRSRTYTAVAGACG